ncbi:MAG: hypothetical protein HY318_15340 [Armatimonadetes bacterium]|nr:hypothetical protein [Armatimonadota bacterium]
MTPPLSRWTAGGGALKISARQNDCRLQVPATADWGNCYVDGQADISTYPYLALWVVEIGRDAKWQMTVNDPDGHTVQAPSEGVGLYVYDLRKTPGWSGTKQFRIYFTVQGRGKYVDVGWIDLFREPPLRQDANGNVQTLLQWQRDNNCLASAKQDGLTISLSPGVGDQWGGANATVNVDTDRFPFVEVDVRGLSPSARWRLEAGGQCTGPEHRSTGVLAFNYRDANHWGGARDVEIRLRVFGSGSEAQFAAVQLVAIPTASAELVERAGHVLQTPSTGEPRLSTGEYRLDYEPSARLFCIHRKDSDASLATRFLEVPGLGLAPPLGQTVRKKKTAGDEISFPREIGGVEYVVQAETFDSVPGLLHWRVTATPRTATTLQSSGHELCFVASPGQKDRSLHPITSQNLCASAIAFAVAPGVGTVFYFQNLTALNPIFDLCHTSPRWLVSLSSRTLGFTNPLDTSVKLPAGKTFTLSDAWLYLTPTETGDSEKEAELFLLGMSAIYDHLPDKPETEYLDWQQLARQSLKDLHRPECWGVYGGKEYLQPYVNTNGAVAQLVPLQDLLPPLMRFQRNSHEGEDTVNKLRSVLPDFWSQQTGTFRMYAQPGEHAWYDTTLQANLCRVALAGDEQARSLCLRTADGLIRLAQGTDYTFERNDVLTFKNELAGGYILFMMYCYELSGEQRFLEESKQATKHIETWGFHTTRETWWNAMACEGLAQLYAATKDERYVHLSLIPLAALLRNTWLWECDFGHARRYATFFGLNADASGIDYIAAMEQHQCWYALRQYYLLTREVLPPFAKCLVSEFIRYAPMTIWCAYPPHLPPESLHQGPAFWKTINAYEAYIPVEDLNDGWRKNGSVGQEIYGAGAAFNVANESYTRIPQAGITLFCEYPVLKAEWDDKQKTLRVQIGGVSHHEAKVEIRFDPKLSGWGKAEDLKARSKPLDGEEALKQLKTTVSDKALRLTIPGESILTVSAR